GASSTAACALRDAGDARNALWALAAEGRPERRERGLSTVLLKAMAGLAASAGLEFLVAPVRPSLKERSPLAPTERYMHWTNRDGQPFDPWIRVHLRLAGWDVATLAHPTAITGSAADWDARSRMR